jgi:hypothetical protein
MSSTPYTQGQVCAPSYAARRLREVWYAVHHPGGLPISVLFVDSDSVFEPKRTS